MKSKAKSPRGVLLSLLTKFSKDAKAGKVYTALELDLLFSEYLSLLKETTKDNFVELELIGWKGKSGIDISKDFKNDFKIKEYRKDKQTGIVKELTHEVPFENVNNIKSLLAEENNQELKLRLFVSGGGCSGFQYGFTFDETQNEDDFAVEKDGVTLLIDAMSMQYLNDSTIDYTKSLMGEQFEIKNPNATSKCGCGSSFAA
jgi:iron-sulfur cluster insertion protein